MSAPISYHSHKSNLVPGYSGGTPRPAFIFAGQSNVDAYQFIASLPSANQQVYTGVNFYQHSTALDVKFVPLNYADNTSYQAGNQSGRYAFQFFLYPQLKTLLNNDVYIVHHAKGGTALNVSTEWLSTGVGNLYTELVFKTKATKNAITDADGVAPSFKFFYWGQGEADAANSTAASNYQTNLINFINNFRTAVGLSSLPFLIGRINQNIDSATYPYWNTVRSAQAGVVGVISNVYLVNQDNAEMASDNTHYTNAGYQTITDNIIAVAQANSLI